MTVTNWVCTKCTALNDLASPACWNCKTPLAEQKQAAGEKEKATREAAMEQQARSEQRQAAFNTALSAGGASIADLLRASVGEKIGINAANPSEIEPAVLLDAQNDFFTVQIGDLLYHLPYSSVIRIVTASGSSVSVGAILKNQYRLVVKVFDLVIYKGSVGFGLSIPM